MDFPDLPANLERTRARIADVQAREGLSGEVDIVAVTKGHTGSAVIAAGRCGITYVGENRVQEALEKQDEVGPRGVEWHLIGHLQTNKARYIPGRFAMVQSVDSARLVESLAGQMERRGGEGETLDVLLQVNVAGEEQKSGCDPAEAEELAGRITDTGRLRLKGLMTMAPLTDSTSVQRKVFSAARHLLETLRCTGLELPVLSMGMSDDFESAVAEGATMVRLGTVLFGARDG